MSSQEASSYRPYRDEFTWPEIGVLFAVLVLAVRGMAKPDVSTSKLAEYYGIRESWARETVKAARDIGTDPYYLAALISFESQWVPDIQNPTSSASGLIQFMERTAEALGTTTQAIRDMTVAQQMVLVRRYFSRSFSGRANYPTLQSLAMQVFYPAARSWTRSREFPQWVQDANPGIVTVGDYMRRVEQRLPRDMRPGEEAESVSQPIDVTFS